MNLYSQDDTHNSAENVRAFYQIFKEEINNGEPFTNNTNETDIYKIFAKWQNKIDDYVANFFKINRNMLLQMINLVRYDKYFLEYGAYIFICSVLNSPLGNLQIYC